MIRNISRRLFVKIAAAVVILLKIRPVFGQLYSGNEVTADNYSEDPVRVNLGVDPDGYSRVYIARDLSPEDNMKKAIDLTGGIESVIDKDDIVVLKPNAQWWRQGTTNTNNMKGFIELVLDIPDFKGEIIIAENHHYMEPNSRGWTTRERNGEYNLNELVEYFNKNGHKNISKYHLVDAGPNPNPRQGNAGNGNIVTSALDGDGYVWLTDIVYKSPENRKCMMTYPVFTSSYSGKRIDLMRGTYQDGRYRDNVKLINFSCLNHHGDEFGITASIKNLMGVVDMTCGYQGTEPEGFYNTHFIGSESTIYKLGKQLRYLGVKYNFKEDLGHGVRKMGKFNSHYSGGALGYWLRTVKMPDLNILAAEYVGWGGRLDLRKRFHMRSVAVSKDPVALDYVGAKELLLKATPEQEKHFRKLNDPDNAPFRLFLEECHNQGIGNLDMERIKVVNHS